MSSDRADRRVLGVIAPLERSLFPFSLKWSSIKPKDQLTYNNNNNRYLYSALTLVINNDHCDNGAKKPAD